MTILRAQVELNKRGLCRCGQRATSELSYTEEMDQRQDASSPSPPSSPLTDRSYQTPPVEAVTQLVPIPEEVQLPSPTSSEEVVLPAPPPCATSPGRVVSGQCCWTSCKVDPSSGSRASSQFFWRSSGLRGKDRARPYPAGRGEVGVHSGDWRVRVEQQLGSSEPGPSSPRSLHAAVMNWHFSHSFRLIFPNTYNPYHSRFHLIKHNMLISDHFAYSLCPTDNRKCMY